MVTLNAFHTFSQNGVTYRAFGAGRPVSPGLPVSATQEVDYSSPEGKLFMTTWTAIPWTPSAGWFPSSVMPEDGRFRTDTLTKVNQPGPNRRLNGRDSIKCSPTPATRRLT